MHSSIITCNVFAMVKQAGKSHSYPSSRSSYATSRKGIGGRPGKNANTPIYLLRRQQCLTTFSDSNQNQVCKTYNMHKYNLIILSLIEHCFFRFTDG